MDRVWYAAYGSNLHRPRLMRYLAGGRPAAGQPPHPGARDPSPPAAEAWSEVPHALRMAGGSARWGGGVAYLDPRPGSGRATVRLWSLSLEQLADVVAQECGLAPGAVAVDPARVEVGGLVVAAARYGRLIRFADHDRVPVLSCTWVDPPPPAPPAAAYRELLRRGLAGGSGLDAAAIEAYLDAAGP